MMKMVGVCLREGKTGLLWACTTPELLRKTAAAGLVSQSCLPTALVVNPHGEKEVSATSTTKVSRSNSY